MLRDVLILIYDHPAKIPGKFLSGQNRHPDPIYKKCTCTAVCINILLNFSAIDFDLTQTAIYLQPGMEIAKSPKMNNIL